MIHQNQMLLKEILEEDRFCATTRTAQVIELAGEWHQVRIPD